MQSFLCALGPAGFDSSTTFAPFLLTSPYFSACCLRVAAIPPRTRAVESILKHTMLAVDSFTMQFTHQCGPELF